MKTGDIVRYKNPVDKIERECLFVIVDGPHDGRVSIKWINSGMRFPPIETVAVGEVSVARIPRRCSVIARDDQRELNNLPKLHEDQQQGRMLVIDEAKAARELMAAARLLGAGDDRMSRIRKHLLDIQDFVFRHRGTRSPEVTGREIEDLKWSVQKALDLT